MLTINKKQARRFILMKQGLCGPCRFSGKIGVLEFIRQAGCIQFDPIDICGKNHELVLQSRVQGFAKSQLYDLLYIDRILFDYFDKVMSIIPIDDWPYFSRRRKYHTDHGRGKEEVDRIAGDIIDIINKKGPVSSSDIGYDNKVNWSWGATKLARAALESLYFRGELVVHHKKNTRKFYDIAKNNLPDNLLGAPNPCNSAEQIHDWLLLRRINSVGMLWNRPSDAFIGVSDFKSDNRKGAFSRLLAAGNITEIKVLGINYPLYIGTPDMELLTRAAEKIAGQERTEFIAPLDNMMWDRKLIRELFDFDYKWEIYTPAKDRKFGYYVLPLLYGENLTGRVEIRKNPSTGQMEIANLWLEEKTRETKKLHLAIDRSMKKFNKFHRA